MITNKELNAVKLSPTKKDFYQIWNELLDTARKISERWDPTSTNESDPGIVLLKVLTAIADKLNYNIDANALEAFMPSAAQEDSMRKLTEMLGYSMKYYQSATTEVKISYTKNNESEGTISGILTLDKFTNIKDIDDSINYITLEPLNLNSTNTSGNVICMEGELVECETDDNNIVSIFHLDDNYRYFLPETQIAENGIFITNVAGYVESEEWQSVKNLNAQAMGSKIFKFGFDSFEGLPYIQFPEDISTLIEDGLKIKYVRTTGAAGNVSQNTLTKLTMPASWAELTSENKKLWHDVANYTVSNVRAATNGANKEGINSAYNNFKKTIGTFDTLVTCRDYMNKIYQLLSTIDNTTPLVSNVIVSDIKDDINRSLTIGTFTSRGVEYKVITKPGKTLTHFDLILYPFKKVTGLNSQAEFDGSFTYDDSSTAEILSALEENKTLSHNFISPNNDELACIRNKYKLRAKVNTVRKVGIIEQASILTTIYTKLFETFNMRNIDFGEEIPYDTLLKVMEEADPRIKSITLDEPELSTEFVTVGNEVFSLTNNVSSDSQTTAKQIFNSLVLRNVLAGRAPLFNYNTDFESSYTEEEYTFEETTIDPDTQEESTQIISPYNTIYPEADTEGNISEDQKIYKLKTDLEIDLSGFSDQSDNKIVLQPNEVIQFKAPSLRTTQTYPAYVNYFLQLDTSRSGYIPAVPATMQTLGNLLKGGPEASSDESKVALEYYINETNFPTNLIQELPISEEIRGDDTGKKFKTKFDEIVSTNLAIFIKDTEDKYRWVVNSAEGWSIFEDNSNIVFYTLIFDKSNTSTNGAGAWSSWIRNIYKYVLDSADSKYNKNNTTTPQMISTLLSGFYAISKSSQTKTSGYLIDSNGFEYKQCNVFKTIATSPFLYYYVPRIWSEAKINTTDKDKGAAAYHTANGLGQEAQPLTLNKNTEYQLKADEFLYINYTSSDENDSSKKNIINKVFSSGTIIKPNFNLEDSQDRAKAHSYSKLNVENYFEDYKDMPGMFTLGTEEQIEIRELVEVTLDEEVTNLYWEIPDVISYDGDKLYFPWNERPISKETGEVIASGVPFNPATMIYSAYTLKEGEYLYWTNKNKTNLSFYGFGTTIIRTINTDTIYKKVSDLVVSSEEISTGGLNINIPWRTYDLSSNGNINKSLTIVENQFINLTAGDELYLLDLTSKETTLNSSKFLTVNTATYKFASSEGVSSLPALNIENKNWEVRSKLDLSMSPSKTQTLLTRRFSTANNEEATEGLIIDKITLINTQRKGSEEINTEIKTLEAELNIPLSIKANKVIQSATIETDVTTKQLTGVGQAENIIADLKLKLFSEERLQDNNNNFINLNNFGDGTFTSINFKEQLSSASGDNTNVEIPLNIILPENYFGLVMLYYKKLKTAEGFAQVTSTKNSIKIFNTTNSLSNSISLKEGCNIIQISENDILKINSNSINEAVVIFSKLSLISKNKEKAINSKLCYKAIETNTAYDQILADIKKVDLDNIFYYNMPIANNLDIDMNERDSEDNLENPLNWFNYNNINNKFVIAKLDSSYFVDGITIAKASKGNF